MSALWVSKEFLAQQNLWYVLVGLYIGTIIKESNLSLSREVEEAHTLRPDSTARYTRELETPYTWRWD